MTSRREFLRGVGGSAGGAFLAGYGLGAEAQSARREITLNGRRITTVDIHAHCIFPEVRDVIAGSPLDGRAFPEFQMLGPDRLEQMNSRGIDYQALSMTIQGHWWYAADRSLAARIVRASDDALAVWVERHPDRFVALSSVALPYPDLAAEQLEYAVTELGARGASIGGQVNGEYPSSERFDPFWAKAVELDVPVFMHPALGAPNIVVENALAGRGGLENVVGGPLESTLFLTHMIFDGTLDRFPTLKIVGGARRRLSPLLSGANGSCLRPLRGRELPQYQDAERVSARPDSCRLNDFLRRGTAAPGRGDGSPVRWSTGRTCPSPGRRHWGLILDSPSLDDAQKEAIAGGNLIRLLRIDV